MEQRAIELIAGKAAWTGLIDSSGARPRPNLQRRTRRRHEGRVR